MANNVTLALIDVLEERTSRAIEVDSETTLLELRAMAQSLDLPSGQGDFQICHDGSVLEVCDDSETLESLGVLSCPVVVVFAQPMRSQKSPPRGAAAAAASRPAAPTVAAAGASGAPAAQAAPAAASNMPIPASHELPEDAVCRICFSGVEEGRLISPCMCLGSMRYVHVHCLNEWRTQSANPRSFYQCDQCQYKYNIERTKYASLLEDPRIVRGAAALLLLFSLMLSAAVLGTLGAEQWFYRLVDFNPRQPWQWIGALWGGRLDYFVSGLLGLAAVGLSQSVRQAWHMNRHVSNAWVMGIVSAFAASGGRATRIFAAGGLVHSMHVAVSFAEKMAKELLTKFGTAILEVQRPD